MPPNPCSFHDFQMELGFQIEKDQFNCVTDICFIMSSLYHDSRWRKSFSGRPFNWYKAARISTPLVKFWHWNFYIAGVIEQITKQYIKGFFCRTGTNQRQQKGLQEASSPGNRWSGILVKNCWIPELIRNLLEILYCPNFIFRIELISQKNICMCNLFFLQMLGDNKLFFYIIKMETYLYFHAKQDLLFLKCLIPLSLKYSESKCVSDSGCPGPLEVKLQLLWLWTVSSVTQGSRSRQRIFTGVTTALMCSRKASSSFGMVLGQKNRRKKTWKLQPA